MISEKGHVICHVIFPHIEKVKKEAPIVGLTFREKVFPTCLSTSDVLPTPEGREGGEREGEGEGREGGEGGGGEGREGGREGGREREGGRGRERGREEKGKKRCEGSSTVRVGRKIFLERMMFNMTPTNRLIDIYAIKLRFVIAGVCNQTDN